MSEGPAGSRLVFISHSSRDTWVARQIASHISAAGATPFLDEADVEVGQDFEQNILSFLDRADELVVLLTPWSVDRPYIWAELGAAWSRRIPIIGILLGMTATELQSREGIPLFLKKRDLLEINQIGLYFEQLEVRVGGLNTDSGGSGQ